jgi:hypothetical protein
MQNRVQQIRGGVGKKDQMIQPYLLERKRAKKWYVRLLKRLLNAAVHIAFVMCNTRSKTLRLDLVKALIFMHRTCPIEPRQCH